MSTTKAILSCCCLLAIVSLADAKEWHGIVPLHSTRADVERLLGPAKDPTKEHVSRHETENEEVTVEYSTGPPCGTGWPGVWRVPHGTVINIIVHPTRELRFSNLHIDESKYKKTDTEGHGPLYFYYTSEEEGLQYEVTQGRVMSIIYSSTAKDDKDLRCPLPNAREWHGLVALHSTRADVERLLGKPNAKYDRYDIGDEVADITYSSGNCANGWKVPKDTVILISVTYHRTFRLSDLQIDMSKFERAPDPYTTNHIYYNNGEEGIRYVVSEGVRPTSGTILNVYYEPSRKDMHLFCPSKDDDTNDPGPLMTHCPIITIGCKDSGPLPVTFSVIYSPPIEKVSFKWTVSEGTIIEGQGTPAITVTAPAGVKKITATIRIDGFPKRCSNTESCSTDVTVSRTATIRKSKKCSSTSSRRTVPREP